uniref:Truncated nef protein n=1 Tax=Human immunodeficiency virus type 1 TaxID=11676 RepID=H9TPV9_HV1|nr:truncated nef protein [Human immunodeficiency virus 1]
MGGKWPKSSVVGWSAIRERMRRAPPAAERMRQAQPASEAQSAAVGVGAVSRDLER